MKMKINNDHMFYEISGNKNGHWLVLMNGINGSHKCSSIMMRDLNKRFKVLSIDLSGHNGESIKVDAGRYSKIVAADMIKSLLDKLGIENACFAGLTADKDVREYFIEMFPGVIFHTVDANAAGTGYLANAMNWLIDKIFFKPSSADAYFEVEHKLNAA